MNTDRDALVRAVDEAQEVLERKLSTFTRLERLKSARAALREYDAKGEK